MVNFPITQWLYCSMYLNKIEYIFLYEIFVFYDKLNHFQFNLPFDLYLTLFGYCYKYL